MLTLGLLVAIVLSLGSHLHVDGHLLTAIPLPGDILAHVPVFDSILPARFDVLVDLVMGAFLALYVDTVRWHEKGTQRNGAALLVLAVAITLAPQAPLPTYYPAIPRYFSSGGDVRRLPRGIVALVVPYGDGEDTMAPMLWQEVSNFRFKMVAGAMYTAGKDGRASLGRSLWGTGTTMDCIMQLEQSGQSPKLCTSDPVQVVRSALRNLGVGVLIEGPLGYPPQTAFSPRLTALLSKVVGHGPVADQGVLVWRHPWA
ncbi:MAG TPA: hypothetical protein VFN61_03130 [Acidimicrobiales bacterium]|nr:hypothetical protein [Acidimicrobiales bacterium]